MAAEMLERDDLSVYIVAGVPKSFKSKLQKFVEEEAKEDGDTMLLNQDLSEWVVAKLRDEKRPRKTRTPASQALWRAYSALSAARYHLQNQPDEEGRVRDLRRSVEDLWRELSPMFADGDEEGVEDADAADGTDGAAGDESDD